MLAVRGCVHGGFTGREGDLPFQRTSSRLVGRLDDFLRPDILMVMILERSWSFLRRRLRSWLDVSVSHKYYARAKGKKIRPVGADRDLGKRPKSPSLLPVNTRSQVPRDSQRQAGVTPTRSS